MINQKKTQIKVNIINGTLPHSVIGEFSSSKVILKPAKPGTGVIAGGAVRIILEYLGLKDVVAKSIGSGNPINTTKAVINGLQQCKDLETVKLERGVPIYVHVNKESTKQESTEKIDIKENK